MKRRNVVLQPNNINILTWQRKNSAKQKNKKQMRKKRTQTNKKNGYLADALVLIEPYYVFKSKRNQQKQKSKIDLKTLFYSAQFRFVGNASSSYFAA